MLKVLLVEDDEVDRIYLERVFRKTDKFETLFFSNGKEALSWLNNEWDGMEKVVTLTDVNMPVMDGVTLLKKLRETPKCENVPVFIFTTSDDDKVIEEAYNYNVSGYLLKPLTITEFEEALAESEEM